MGIMAMNSQQNTTHWILEFEQVHYTYPIAQEPALNGLTLRLKAGKKSVIIGQNGCGKSTLFMLAAGLYKPQLGRVLSNSQPLSYNRQFISQWRQNTGLVFQDPEQQLVAPTVAADISYGLCNLNLPENEIAQRVEQILIDFDLQALATRPIHHLSLGQKKRVALAGVMILRPKLLLLDEPTAYLDPLQNRKLLAKLAAIQASGTTILIATHDLNFVYEWADWIFVMHQGKLVLEGEAKDIFSQKIITELQLGLPLLWEVWEALPQELRLPKIKSMPKTIDELREYLNHLIFKKD
jgi:cobalt/nickel transport system ATP-binding protein